MAAAEERQRIRVVCDDEDVSRTLTIITIIAGLYTTARACASHER